jgi:hypothetical protein
MPGRTRTSNQTVMGDPSIPPHCWHGVIEGGARVHTVMKMLGDTSAGMTLVYAHLSDASVRQDYLKVLGPGALIAGPLAETVRVRAMRQAMDRPFGNGSSIST